ncbi:cell division cycle- protein [Salix suchowensis]|nr:cell division cycle- protein [Salix suchowensis]
MSFLRRIIDSTHPYKKQKRHPKPDNDDPSLDMPALFTQSKPFFLNVPPASRQSSVRNSRLADDIDNFLSSDLELSFASTVSLHSPPRDPLSLTPESDDSVVPMDISPAPPPKPPLTIPTSPGDAMDVDSDPPLPMPSATFSVMPHTAAPTVNTFNNLFFDTVSPRRSFESPAKPQHKKRRSASPEPTRYNEFDISSSPAPSSPSQAKFERMQAYFGGLGAPSANGLKRPRRPALSAMIQPSDAGVRSAFPVLNEPTQEDIDPRHLPPTLPPTRRAVSALLPPKGFGDFSSDEGSFDGPDMSSPAQAYAKRQQVKTIRRCDGTDDFRPLTGATAMVMRESPSSRFAGMVYLGSVTTKLMVRSYLVIALRMMA